MRLNKDTQTIISRTGLGNKYLIAFMKLSHSNFKISLT